ncbi:MAG: cobalamin-dependent protein [Candidatus Hodarchaeales archaeon]|jgi:radical SAM superfamily enzyme YgiQ (UPF0313 family)
MANILFLEPKLRTDKLGICYLSAMLKKAEHEVDLVQDETWEAAERIRDEQIDWVMYSVSTGNSSWYLDANGWLKFSRELDFTSVMGGPHFTYFPEDGDNIFVDYIVSGPAEDVIVGLVEDRPAQKFITGSVPDIEALHLG